MRKPNGAVLDTEEGARCAFMGYGKAVSGYGNTDDGRKFYAVTGSEIAGIPGDDAREPAPDGPDILLIFRDNSAIQRVIDELTKLRDK